MVGLLIGQKGGALLFAPVAYKKSISYPPLGDKKHSLCGSVIVLLENPTTALSLPA
jgi:hypothetical protein